jgi:hypothetical protein
MVPLNDGPVPHPCDTSSHDVSGSGDSRGICKDAPIRDEPVVACSGCGYPKGRPVDPDFVCRRCRRGEQHEPTQSTDASRRDVEFVGELPESARRPDKWKEIRATLAGRPGEWAHISALGGYPRERLKQLGCEVRTVKGVLYARWPNG